MTSSAFCEQCKRPTNVIYRCDECGNGVCVNCLATRSYNTPALCRKCADAAVNQVTGRKALSGYAEWFWCLAKNYKDVENRDWSMFRYIPFSQLPVRIYLHASKTKTPIDEQLVIKKNLTPEQWLEFCKVDWDKYRGQIIGEITIVGQVTTSGSKWFFGKYGFLVQDGVLYGKFIPYIGHLGFFEVKMEGNKA